MTTLFTINVMQKIVLNYQIGFVFYRNINENIIIFLEVQYYMHDYQKPIFSFLMDIEKTFQYVFRSFYKLLLRN
jgi:hypothetical protein